MSRHPHRDATADLDLFTQARVEVALASACVPLWADVDVELACDAHDLVSLVRVALAAPTDANVQAAERAYDRFSVGAAFAQAKQPSPMMRAMPAYRRANHVRAGLAVFGACVACALSVFEVASDWRADGWYLDDMLAWPLVVDVMVDELAPAHPDVVRRLLLDGGWTVGAAMQAADLACGAL